MEELRFQFSGIRLCSFFVWQFLAEPISAQHVLRRQLSLIASSFLGKFHGVVERKFVEQNCLMNLFDDHWRTTWTCIVEFSQILLHWGWQSVAKSLVAGQLRSFWMIPVASRKNPVAMNVIAWDRKKTWQEMPLISNMFSSDPHPSSKSFEQKKWQTPRHQEVRFVYDW